MTDYVPELAPLTAYGPGDLDDTTLAAQARRHTNGAGRNGHKPAAAMPPVARDLASVERTTAWRRALARAVKGRAA